MCYFGVEKVCAETQSGVDRCTYQSPPASARDELALVPAAAEAKEVGAIVVRKVWLRVASMGVRLATPDISSGRKVLWGGCDRVSRWRAGRRFVLESIGIGVHVWAWYGQVRQQMSRWSARRRAAGSPKEVHLLDSRVTCARVELTPLPSKRSTLSGVIYSPRKPGRSISNASDSEWLILIGTLLVQLVSQR